MCRHCLLTFRSTLALLPRKACHALYFRKFSESLSCTSCFSASTHSYDDLYEIRNFVNVIRPLYLSVEEPSSALGEGSVHAFRHGGRAQIKGPRPSQGETTASSDPQHRQRSTLSTRSPPPTPDPTRLPPETRLSRFLVLRQSYAFENSILMQ